MSEARPTLTPDDDAAIRMLAGAHFHPDATIILPSGAKLSSNEMQALTSFYAPRNDDPPPSTYDHPAGDPAADRAALAARVDSFCALSGDSSRRVDDPFDPLSATYDRQTGDPATDRAALAARVAFIRATEATFRQALQNAEREVQARCDEFNGHAPERRTTKITKPFRVVWCWIRDAWILLFGGLR